MTILLFFVAAYLTIVQSLCRRGTKGAEKLLTIPGHSGPARDVVWISMDEEAKVATFASCSHDQARK